ncbi:hypothetical protein GOL30_29320 [Sinorhizobium medicae]|uniref:Uncharacterized protein n=1 Tax=Sinorhizobium medicae TaxID=110321 RepID=A0A6G1WF14_9HYPH|nr:hypothetical protein [Sinorhizobium medicae]MDX0408494.1 hypothetical protein [Sinorhizobium medicae]MDX0414558.1 hypothetical protein [Sinorhizobium medicae]MDX0420422.1 hypothetical protein [Sinorhizobium medicae]MDX0426687.1 hypothetical protein [Sinorhizobium medicae]MDX0429731.1 hypothetical protein [Sinorhizobium medicae]
MVSGRHPRQPEQDPDQAERQAQPVLPERAHELARMLALPDASQVTAEQMAYRGKVKADIEAAEPVDEERAA